MGACDLALAGSFLWVKLGHQRRPATSSWEGHMEQWKTTITQYFGLDELSGFRKSELLSLVLQQLTLDEEKTGDESRVECLRDVAEGENLRPVHADADTRADGNDTLTHSALAHDNQANFTPEADQNFTVNPYHTQVSILWQDWAHGRLLLAAS
ncbi:hypothetical protein E2C01_052889 [Portunus trituberculatus]|uniref:Uncharacterized protein n=1 Tax=Portunus trituberculatus TaxID=210409 RepID=A0A5B7GMP5_PORTR|nr:hypothetical protein [Portunus trituberculatus]